MISGTILSANIGNFHWKGSKTTFSLFDPELAKMIGKKIHTNKYDIVMLQESWIFAEELFGYHSDDYEVCGLNDMIAVRKSFGTLVPNSYHSYSRRFLDLESGNITELELGTYNGTTNWKQFGIPMDFDVSSVIIKVNGTDQKILVLNVHVTSASWHDELRAKEIQQYIIEDGIRKAKEQAEGRILIAGDFNEDETRNPMRKSAQLIKNLIEMPEMNDASLGNPQTTTNYPFKKLKLDHIIGTAEFSDYTIEQVLLDENFVGFRKKHRFSWWMYLDHIGITAKFKFN